MASRILDFGRSTGLKGQIHYSPRNPALWSLNITSDDQINNVGIGEFDFFVPDTIMTIWEAYNLDRAKAVQLKEEFFSRIFIFNQGLRPALPFFIVNIGIDWEWLNRVREREGNLG